jgi:hypothetical protein
MATMRVLSTVTRKRMTWNDKQSRLKKNDKSTDTTSEKSLFYEIILCSHEIMTTE